MNVKVNASSYKDKDFVIDIISQGNEIERKVIALEAEIIELVNKKIV